jgi:hypothetical protein
MMRNVGELLVACYFPDDFERIRARAAQASEPATDPCLRELGFAYEDLGREMARRWGMPAPIVGAIADEAVDPKTAGPLATLTALGHGLTSALYRGDAREARSRVTLLTQKIGQPLGLTPDAIKDISDSAAAEARKTFARMAGRSRDFAILDRSRSALAFAPETRAPAADPPAPARAPAAPSIEPSSAADSEVVGEAPGGELFDRLAKEVDHVLETRAGSDLHAVLLMVLEGMQRGAGFDRVLFALVTPDKRRIQGRLAIGARSELLKDAFSFTLGLQGGPIGVALSRQQELLLRGDWELRSEQLRGAAARGRGGTAPSA